MSDPERRAIPAIRLPIRFTVAFITVAFLTGVLTLPVPAIIILSVLASTVVMFPFIRDDYRTIKNLYREAQGNPEKQQEEEASIMKTLTVIEAKLNPDYWQLISSGEKTIEVRDELAGGCGSFFRFVHPDTGMLLGWARINSISTLGVGWTIPMAARLAGISEQDAQDLFGGRVSPKSGAGTQPLFIYDITPTDRLD